MNSSEKYEVWQVKNREKLSTLKNPQLAIVQRSAEILCIDDFDEVKQKIRHHLENLKEIIMRAYTGLYKPLTPECKHLYGNERHRIKSVRGYSDYVRTRLEPILIRSDVVDPSGKLRNEFDTLVCEFHRRLDSINDMYGRNQTRWPFYLSAFDDFKLRLLQIIPLIEERL